MKQFFTRLALVISALLPLMSQAQFTPDPTHVYRIVNRQTQLAMTMSGTDEGEHAYQAALPKTYEQNAGQEWMFEAHSSGTSFHIKNRNSRLYLGLADYLSPNAGILGQYYV